MACINYKINILFGILISINWIFCLTLKNNTHDEIILGIIYVISNTFLLLLALIEYMFQENISVSREINISFIFFLSFADGIIFLLCVYLVFANILELVKLISIIINNIFIFIILKLKFHYYQNLLIERVKTQLIV